MCFFYITFAAESGTKKKGKKKEEVPALPPVSSSGGGGGLFDDEDEDDLFPSSADSKKGNSFMKIDTVFYKDKNQDMIPYHVFLTHSAPTLYHCW